MRLSEDIPVTDRSTDPIVVEYAVRELFKGKSPKAAANRTAKKLSGRENYMLGSGITLINPKKLEVALWGKMADYVIDGIGHFKPGKEIIALNGAVQHFHQKEAIKGPLRALVVSKLGRDPFHG